MSHCVSILEFSYRPVGSIHTSSAHLIVVYSIFWASWSRWLCASLGTELTDGFGLNWVDSNHSSCKRKAGRDEFRIVSFYLAQPKIGVHISLRALSRQSQLVRPVFGFGFFITSVQWTVQQTTERRWNKPMALIQRGIKWCFPSNDWSVQTFKNYYNSNTTVWMGCVLK